jgi:hypothetical protein
MKDSPDPIKILLIRSATNTLNATIKSLKDEFPAAMITVLAPESARKTLKSDSNINSIISAGSINRMSVFSLQGKVIKEIRSGAFDLAVSLYNIDHGMGYSNIDCIAWASGAKSIRGYNARGTFVQFNGWGVLKKYALEKTSFAWILINGFTTVILFSFITLGLLCEWIIRKIFAINPVKSKYTARSQGATLAQYVECSSTSQDLPPEVH